MSLQKCQYQPDLDSISRKASTNEIGKLLTYSKKLFDQSCLHNLMSVRLCHLVKISSDNW